MDAGRMLKWCTYAGIRVGFRSIVTYCTLELCKQFSKTTLKSCFIGLSGHWMSSGKRYSNRCAAGQPASIKISRQSTKPWRRAL